MRTGCRGKSPCRRSMIRSTTSWCDATQTNHPRAATGHCGVVVSLSVLTLLFAVGRRSCRLAFGLPSDGFRRIRPISSCTCQTAPTPRSCELRSFSPFSGSAGMPRAPRQRRVALPMILRAPNGPH
jgi:hypothetical protein